MPQNEPAVALTNDGENELYNQMETCREKPAAALDKRAGVRSAGVWVCGRRWAERRQNDQKMWDGFCGRLW